MVDGMVICCGPESSGTRLLTGLVSVMPVRAIHLSQPDGTTWWDWHEVMEWARGEGALAVSFVVITRRPDVVDLSALYKGYRDPTLAQQRRDRQRAMEMLATIEKAYWVSYEALICEPAIQMMNLAGWLGHKYDITRIRRTDKGALQLDAEDTGEQRRRDIERMEAEGIVEVRDENAKWLRIIEG